MATATAESLVRAYYRAIDAGDYEALSAILTPGFRQARGDQTLDGRERFVRFMRDERPHTDTTHDVEIVYRPTSAEDDPAEVAVRGRLLRADGSVSFGFVDVFALEDRLLDRLVTYTNRGLE